MIAQAAICASRVAGAIRNYGVKVAELTWRRADHMIRSDHDEIVLTGKRSARSAYEIGLVNRLAEPMDDARVGLRRHSRRCAAVGAAARETLMLSTEMAASALRRAACSEYAYRARAQEAEGFRRKRRPQWKGAEGGERMIEG